MIRNWILLFSLLVPALLPADSHAQDILRQRLKRSGSFQKLVLDDTLVEDRHLDELQNALFRSVNSISLQRTAVTDVGVKKLRQLPHLRELDLSGTKVTDEGVAYLKAAVGLKELGLADTDCSDTALYHLKELSLKRLNLENTRITDRGLRYLKGMNELHELRLGGTAVTDEGIVNLRGRPLQRLDLRLTNVTDGAIAYLISFPLDEVILYDTKISDNGISTLRRSLPSLSINGREGGY